MTLVLTPFAKYAYRPTKHSSVTSSGSQSIIPNFFSLALPSWHTCTNSSSCNRRMHKPDNRHSWNMRHSDKTQLEDSSSKSRRCSSNQPYPAASLPGPNPLHIRCQDLEERLSVAAILTTAITGYCLPET